jgi:hypothetical protein
MDDLGQKGIYDLMDVPQSFLLNDSLPYHPISASPCLQYYVASPSLAFSLFP